MEDWWTHSFSIWFLFYIYTRSFILISYFRVIVFLILFISVRKNGLGGRLNTVRRLAVPSWPNSAKKIDQRKSQRSMDNGQRFFWEKKLVNLLGLGRFFGSRPPRTFLFLFASLKERTLKEKKKRKRRRNVTVQGLKNHAENQIPSRSWTCFHSSSNFTINFIFFKSQSIKNRGEK